jgi:hypothetical protein
MTRPIALGVLTGVLLGCSQPGGVPVVALESPPGALAKKTLAFAAVTHNPLPGKEPPDSIVAVYDDGLVMTKRGEAFAACGISAREVEELRGLAAALPPGGPRLDVPFVDVAAWHGMRVTRRFVETAAASDPEREPAAALLAKLAAIDHRDFTPVEPPPGWEQGLRQRVYEADEAPVRVRRHEGETVR